MSSNIVDYSNIYDIKKYAKENIMPNFFDMEDISTFNVGLLGYTNEMIGNITEDIFNGMSFLLQENYTASAKLKQTIYSSLARYHYTDVFANPSACNLALFIAESDIISYGEKTVDSVTDIVNYNFIIDRQMNVLVEQYNYMIDYNLLITARKYRDEYVFQAKFDKSFNNTISNINAPYLTSKRIKIGTKRYLMISIPVHQVVRHDYTESLISNDVLNLPVLSFEFDGQLCGFNIFYKETEDAEEVQLDKVLYNGNPLSTPFCFFKMMDNKVRVSFSTKTEYFQPAFGSEIRIEYYTTSGADADFTDYTGTNINVTPYSDVYSYNNGLVLIAMVASSSKGGYDMPTTEELRNKANELSTTANSLADENDIDAHFRNLYNHYGNKIKFAKLRDDALARKFVAFAILKDGLGNIYGTNSLNIKMREYKGEFDKEYSQSNRWIISPGRVFALEKDSNFTLVPLGHMKVDDDLSEYDDKYLYSNPYLISISKFPQSTSFYINSVDTQIKVDYKYANDASYFQFNCNKLTITRDAIGGDNSYNIRVVISPTSNLSSGGSIYETDQNLTTESYLDNQFHSLTSTEEIASSDGSLSAEYIKILLVLNNGDNRSGYIELEYTDYDKTNDMYIFECNLETDDYISSDNLIRFTNVEDFNTQQVTGSVLASMHDSKVELAIFYKDPADTTGHEFSSIEAVKDLSLTNLYQTDSERTNFIFPLDVIESTVSYEEETDVHTEVVDIDITIPPTDITVTSQIGTNSIIVEWTPYSEDISAARATDLIYMDGEVIEVSEPVITSKGKYQYTIPSLYLNRPTDIKVAYKVTPYPSFAHFENYVYTCDCDAMTGIENMDKICPICKTKVKQIVDANAYSYSCECNAIESLENVGMHCKKCGKPCVRIIPPINRRYSCDCGSLWGNDKEDHICAKCYTKVQDNFDGTEYSYSCQCGELNGFEHLGEFCENCNTTCIRTRDYLTNQKEVIIESRTTTIVVGSGDSISIPEIVAEPKKLTALTYSSEEAFLIKLSLVPVVSYTYLTNGNYLKLLENLLYTYQQIKDEITYLHNNFSIIFRFYNTYGYSKNFITDNGSSVGSVNLKISFAIKATEGANIDELFNDVKIFIKEYIESNPSSNDGTNNIYLSNITTSVERKFSSVRYCKFLGFNNFDPEIQIIEDTAVNDLSKLPKEDRLVYIPEYLTIALDDITLIEL